MRTSSPFSSYERCTRTTAVRLFRRQRARVALRLAFGALAAGGCQESQILQPLHSPGKAQADQIQQLGFDLASISAGAQGACGLAAAGQAYCWGGNILGNGTFNPSSIPVAVSGGISFATLSGPGGFFGSGTCGLTKAGQTYCWGAGFLGDGTPFGGSLVPIAIADTLAFASISVNDFTCAVSKGGQADCWGIDGEGELGNGSSTLGVNFNYPVAVLGGLDFTSVSTGGFFACGLTKAGQAYCWGSNIVGQLGSGDFSPGSS